MGLDMYLMKRVRVNKDEDSVDTELVYWRKANAIPVSYTHLPSPRD